MFRQQSEPRARRAHPGQRQRRARACGGRSGLGGAAAGGTVDSGSCRAVSWELLVERRRLVQQQRGRSATCSDGGRREPACNSRRKCEVQKESGDVCMPPGGPGAREGDGWERG